MAFENFDRHLAKAKQLKIKNIDGIEDTFLIEPLPFKYLGDFFAIGKKMTKADIKPTDTEEDKNRKIMEALDSETLEMMGRLCLISLQQSYKEAPTDKLEKFIAANFMKIFAVVMDVNLGNL